MGNYQTAVLLDKMKKVGFEYATLAGITVGIADMMIPEKEKEELIERTSKEIDKIQKQYENGVITNGERYNKVVDAWTHTTNEVAEAMFEGLKKADNGFNPVYMMADSGARGSKDQIRQLAGMRGLMAKPQKKITGQIGEIIESPITSNFKEGLSVLEYFISTHGARKGLADTALKTADAGYLTRRLVDVAQDVIINEDDCGTILGLNVGALKEGEEVIESLRDRILGRVALEDVIDPITNEELAKAGEEINEEAAARIEESGIETAKIRSVLTCESKRGVCAKCYGRNLATNRMADLGEAVGVMAAQSIGEPGTQLTLRTFHIGGTAARIAEQSKATAKADGKVVFKKVKTVAKKDAEKNAWIVLNRDGEINLLDEQERVRARYNVPYSAILRVNEKAQVQKGDILFEWDPYTNTILSDHNGKVEFIDLKEDVTYREELDETTGLRQRVVIEHKDKTLRPHITILDEKGKKVGNYSIPTRAYLLVHDGDKVQAGDSLVKIPRDISKTRDITGGLPRVAELLKPESQRI